jgi:hypothetical protein
VLLPFYYSLEDAKYKQYHEGSVDNRYMGENGSDHSVWSQFLIVQLCLQGLLFLGCVNALAYNLIHSLVIKVTSAVTTTVIGEMKIVLILVLSAVMLGEKDWPIGLQNRMLTCLAALLLRGIRNLDAANAGWMYNGNSG